MNIHTEERHRAGMWEEAQTICALSKAHHALSTSTCAPTRKLSKPCTIGILCRLPHVGMISY